MHQYYKSFQRLMQGIRRRHCNMKPRRPLIILKLSSSWLLSCLVFCSQRKQQGTSQTFCPEQPKSCSSNLHTISTQKQQLPGGMYIILYPKNLSHAHQTTPDPVILIVTNPTMTLRLDTHASDRYPTCPLPRHLLHFPRNNWAFRTRLPSFTETNFRQATLHHLGSRPHSASML